MSLHHSNLLSVCCLFWSFGFNPPCSLCPLFLCVILTHSHTLSLTHASTHTHTHPCTHAHTACFIAFAHSSKTISGQLKTGAGFDFARPKSFNMMMVTFGLNGSETFAELNYFFTLVSCSITSLIIQQLKHLNSIKIKNRRNLL